MTANNNSHPHPKITPRHQDRSAVVYVRQSTAHQVAEHRESADLQYQLQQRAAHLGWAASRILVIDDDQGISGQSVENRPGFQRLLAEVSLGRVGIIFGREVSRLSRSSKDWHQLLELCGLFGVLIGDAESVCDPTDPNDRLLLGLRGMMSEAELHVLKSRLHQGKLNKARRGELFTCVPIGYVRCPSDGVIFDPDQQVRSVISLLFEKFEELGSVPRVNAWCQAHGIQLGVRTYKGENKGQLRWVTVRRRALYDLLTHPMYAGVYVYGRTKIDPAAKVLTGRSRRHRLLEEEWECFLKDRVPAYITYEQYQRNRQRLSENDRGQGASRLGPGRSPTLLNARVECGHCGARMQVRNGRPGVVPRYACDYERLERQGPMCQSVVAAPVDQLMEGLIFQSIQPAALELSLKAGEAKERDRQQLHEQWQKKLQRAGYETELAKRRYESVDPENRLVAGTLERAWEDALKSQVQLEADYSRFQQEQPRQLSEADRKRIQTLTENLPRLWHAETTTGADRRAVVRELIERVVVTRCGSGSEVEVVVHWWGGILSHHQVRQGLRRGADLPHYEALCARVRELRGQGKTGEEIADLLNEEGFHPSRSDSFTGYHVRRLMIQLGLTQASRGVNAKTSLRQGERWLTDFACEIEEPVIVVHRWRWSGWLHARQLPGKTGRWIVWADNEEIARLKRLRSHELAHPRKKPSEELTTPTKRPIT